MPIISTAINSPRDEGFKLAASFAVRALDETLHSQELLYKEEYLANPQWRREDRRGDAKGTNQTSLRETLTALRIIMDMESNGELSGHRIHLECGTRDGWHLWCRTESICFTVSTSVPNCSIYFTLSCEYRWTTGLGKPVLNLYPKLHMLVSRYPAHGKFGKHRRGVNTSRWVEPSGVALFPVFRYYHDAYENSIRFRYWVEKAVLDIALSQEELEQLLKHPDMPWVRTVKSKLRYSGYDNAKKWKDKRSAKIERSWDEDTDIRQWKHRHHL